ncbi:hypothetical protein CARUB_v10012068mg [Capsella rubella]|uniref:BRO1 domain-containing protein n=1 Tax=Capsella rubella TaxID=81985 RepID=R0IIH7_9BRAS|nr:uncharacterized protein LOC17897809 [Capsella rubella]EOA36688.1 hypothetical protein CARUB_v10012068mg [Capsella rubella]
MTTMMQYVIPEPKTKEIVFEKTLQTDSAVTLVEFKELTGRRKVIEESVNKTSKLSATAARFTTGGLTSPSDQDLYRLGKYLPLLLNLVHYFDKLKRVPNLKIRWSSGLVSQTLIQRTCPKFFQVDNIMFEVAMVTFVNGIKLRERAMELASTDCKKSVTIYREASGVFHHLSKELLPSLQNVVPLGKLPELTPPLCSSLSLLCLAEGQAVTTKNAEESGTSTSLLSKLHYGICQLISEAYAILSSRAKGEYKDLSTRFLEYVSTLGALHELKSQKHLAKLLESEDRVGEAIGVLRRALAAAKKSTPSKDDTWISIFKTERDEAAKTMSKYEKLNDSMMLQKIPVNNEIPFPEGKKIVELISYTPTRLERELRFKL